MDSNSNSQRSSTPVQEMPQHMQDMVNDNWTLPYRNDQDSSSQGYNPARMGVTPPAQMVAPLPRVPPAEPQLTRNLQAPAQKPVKRGRGWTGNPKGRPPGAPNKPKPEIALPKEPKTRGRPIGAKSKTPRPAKTKIPGPAKSKTSRGAKSKTSRGAHNAVPSMLDNSSSSTENGSLQIPTSITAGPALVMSPIVPTEAQPPSGYAQVTSFSQSLQPDDRGYDEETQSWYSISARAREAEISHSSMFATSTSPEYVMEPIAMHDPTPTTSSYANQGYQYQSLPDFEQSLRNDDIEFANAGNQPSVSGCYQASGNGQSADAIQCTRDPLFFDINQAVDNGQSAYANQGNHDPPFFDINQAVDNGQSAYANQGNHDPLFFDFNQAVDNGQSAYANQGNQYPVLPDANQSFGTGYFADPSQGNQYLVPPEPNQGFGNGYFADPNQGNQYPFLRDPNQAFGNGYFAYDDNNDSSSSNPFASSGLYPEGMPAHLAPTQPPNGQHLPAPETSQAYDASGPVTDTDESLSGLQPHLPIDPMLDTAAQTMPPAPEIPLSLDDIFDAPWYDFSRGYKI